MTIEEIKDEIRKQLLADNRPWVIAFSGGKDSSCLLHLVIEVILELKAEGIEHKKVYVMSADTGVENPIIEAYHANKMREIADFVAREELNMEVHLVVPKVEDSFLVCLVGKGMASPNRMFRWCTERIKIRPTSDYLNKILSKNQSIIMVLGVRMDESTARAESIEKQVTNSRELSKHPNMENSFCYSPIKYLSTKDLWAFLTTNDAPYGSHVDMIELYDVGSGEADCNIIMNPNNESCAKTRFGCWVCTVVEKDHSMEGAIQNGNAWMQPYNDFRNKIYVYRYDHTKRREQTKQGWAVPGAFLMEVRKELLVDLFKMELQLKDKLKEILGKDYILTNDEIIAINNAWKMDGDFSNEALRIANQFGRNFEIEESKIDSNIVEQCLENDLNPLFFDQLMQLGLEHMNSGSLRRTGVFDKQMELISMTIQENIHNDSIPQLEDLDQEDLNNY